LTADGRRRLKLETESWKAYAEAVFATGALAYPEFATKSLASLGGLSE
jgi:hypothetical protein